MDQATKDLLYKGVGMALLLKDKFATEFDEIIKEGELSKEKMTKSFDEAKEGIEKSKQEQLRPLSYLGRQVDEEGREGYSIETMRVRDSKEIVDEMGIPLMEELIKLAGNESYRKFLSPGDAGSAPKNPALSLKSF
jgi:polyhydroxyalkanoate synthesis regulator phasin